MIKLAIVGYGNLGKGVEAAVRQNPDMELVAVFTRRDPETLLLQTPGVPVLPLEQLDAMAEGLDVLILCGGSATDLPEMTPALAAKCNVVDSFDNHSRIPEHIAQVHKAAKAAGTTAIVSCGWDPGLFSLARVYAQAALPKGESYTFWGPGLSQGHSDAIRRIPGVLDARQYTVPVEAALERVRSGENPELTARQKHTRHCYVVAEDGADKDLITQTICQMPGYFADYDTTVQFITKEELIANHSTMPHGGKVIRAGNSADGSRQTIEYSLTLESNPKFTAGILVACARAAVRMHRRGETGCATMPEIRPCDLLMESIEDIRAHMI
jgi:diaminopimelate dehydrogenase